MNTKSSENLVPMTQAAEYLATLYRAIDEGRLHEALSTIFNSTRLDNPAAVDLRISVMQLLRGACEAAKEAKTAWTQRCQQLDYLLDQLKDHTMNVMVGNGLTQAEGKLGRICRQNNSQSALKLGFKPHSHTYSNVVAAQDIERFEIPDQYLQREVVVTLKNDAIKRDVEAGTKLSWATVERGEHVRIRQ